MIDTKIVAYNERCYILDDIGIPYDIYWFCGVAYFSFYNELNLREALDVFGL